MADAPDILARHREKRMQNLEWANKVRVAQAEMKRRLRDGRIQPLRMLEGHDETWSRFAREVKVGVMLNAIPRLGTSTVKEILYECDLDHDDRLKHATEEQTERLIGLVRMLLNRE